ncbi:MAG: Na+/H+ antiporter, NhaA family protein, nonfunctional [Candidatus Giovannonibacteria bacterium GW2011_GWA2_44_13b]|uniref:Na+/H+ antiporter, NhaA family protein, nonfunctional n=2 Tax=Candidatus Giovannoniibacteriota TaxID=1752738 RepID=A0A0G1H1E0_9BACT|nr:MAG: Na+/H+ antiporter, NhaA family protein, nonfunctional [Candidatus Giovannonibacteria bacterium GW2011_GWA2_44_13b]
MDNQPLSKKEVYELNRVAKKQEAEIAEKKKQRKSIIIWSVVGLAVLGSVWGMIILAKRSSDPGPSPIITTAISADDQTTGNKDSKKILVEYSDFQCPACKAYQPLVKQLLKEHGTEFLFVYRHFPLPQHKNAKAGAYAAEAAGVQGKFWEMHDKLFDGQTDWAEKGNAGDIFIEYAKSLNLDINKFKEDFASDGVHQKVDRQYKSGVANFVNSTPTFFINGKKIQPRSYEEFVKLVEEVNG